MKYLITRNHILFLFFFAIVINTGGIVAQNYDCPNFKKLPIVLDGWTGKTGQKIAQKYGCIMTGGGEIELSGTESTPSSINKCENIDSSDNSRHRFKVYTKYNGNNGYDPNVTCIQLPVVPNDDFLYSIRLGNTCGGGEAEGLYYTMTVDPSHAFLCVHFAIVLQYIEGHTDEQNPEFIIRILDDKGKLIDQCAELRVSSHSVEDKPGWHICPGISGPPVAIKEWTKVAFNLSKPEFIEKEITIEILTGDCSMVEHYGYAYVALECSLPSSADSDCAPGDTDTVAFVSATEIGNGTYKWEIRKNGKTYPTNSADNQQILYLTEEDFDQIDEDDKDGTIDCICTLSSYMNPDIPCIAEQEKSVTNTKPRVKVIETISCNRNASFINNSSISSSGAGTIDTTKTVWRIEDSVYHTHSQVSHQFKSGGDHTISLYVENSIKNCSAEKSFTYTIIDSIYLNISSDKPSYCIGDIAEFSATGATSYTWRIGDSVYTGKTISHKLNPGDTIISLTGSIGYCSTVLEKAISVQRYPRLSVAGDTLICLGESTDLTVSYDIEGSFIWSSSNSGKPVLSYNPSYSASPSESSLFYILLTTINNCTSIDSFYVHVVKPEITIDYPEICFGDTATLSVQSDFASDLIWRSVPEQDLKPEGNINNRLSVSPDETTTYFVKAIGPAPDFCTSTEVSQTVTVFPYPVPRIYSALDYIDAEEPVVGLADSSTYGVYSFWDLGDGSTSTARNLIYSYKIPLEEDSIIVFLTSFNKLRCESSTSQIFPVQKLLLRFPNAFIPQNGDIFKPATENTFTKYHMKVYNRWGELVFETKDINKGWDGTVREGDAPSGNYVWVVTFKVPGKERIYSKKGNLFLVR